MRLYLVQHGRPVPKEQDPDRPLSDEGRREVERVANFLSQAGIRVPRVEHSGKTRAAQTAELLVKRVNPGAAAEPRSGLGPLDDPASFASSVAEQEEDRMLVGHLPHLDRLASLLAAGDQEAGVADFKQGGVVCLVRGDSGSWSI
ncbi:MAG: phosphohistidine phosphatase SixA, partial [Desulfobacteraceae bacterium]